MTEAPADLDFSEPEPLECVWSWTPPEVPRLVLAGKLKGPALAVYIAVNGAMTRQEYPDITALMRACGTASRLRVEKAIQDLYYLGLFNLADLDFLGVAIGKKTNGAA